MELLLSATQDNILEEIRQAERIIVTAWTAYPPHNLGLLCFCACPLTCTWDPIGYLTYAVSSECPWSAAAIPSSSSYDMDSFPKSTSLYLHDSLEAAVIDRLGEMLIAAFHNVLLTDVMPADSTDKEYPMISQIPSPVDICWFQQLTTTMPLATVLADSPT
uniref:Uncharacterized protein n=1 Tax=Romanomermis culicivorax TaxID=13658 RepID=A0A915J6Q0_ROMCU